MTMKKLALALIAASAAVFGFGLVAQAQGYTPTIPPIGPVTPGGSYTVTVNNCVPGEQVTFTQLQSTPTVIVATCSGALPTLTGSVIGLLLPQQGALPTASATFTAAPTAPGTYNGTAVGAQSGSTPFSFTIPGQTATTVPPPTTAAPVPTTQPALVGGLPATGSGGISTTTGIAVGLLVVGLGLFVVAQVRRRQEPNPA
jgi:uncharacterized membrane protein YtjA (UPF0391 family)